MFVPLAPWAGHYGHSTDIYSRNVGREREKARRRGRLTLEGREETDRYEKELRNSCELREGE